MSTIEPESGGSPTLDPIFGKSASNRSSELKAIELLVSDPRFQVPDVEAKKAILQLLATSTDSSYRTFDAVMTNVPRSPINVANLAECIDDMRLVELKATKKAIRNVSLNGFFFGATKREYDLAAALGDRYLFAFVVLSADNDYGQPFFVLLTLQELERRTRTKRIQYQVNLGSDNETGGLEPNFGRFEGVIQSPDE
jgi:hypothetical protein